jgi:hypothetical protein
MATDQSIQESETMTESDNLLGTVFAVPDKWWGFEAEGREVHPGACVVERESMSEVDLLKGTGAENKDRYRPTEMIIVPTEMNGLEKLTLFSLKPRPFRMHKIRNLLEDNIMGHLSKDDLQKLQTAMLRLFGARG